ncbi:uncharacterized protein LOC109855606 [Pseudomyrmex gracilis]|uniref:uncharacterized protein LOC109855606 n=1 Tax=Pseudomyrmex gracilis TaxID=219809 RepID=UPI000995BA6C|nr:uncharacterized protein LOC109855606 [Pseudomyrmex gracilis]
MAKAMDFFDTRFFRINKLFLSFVGLWPYQTSFMKALTLSFAIFGIGIMCLPQIAYLMERADDLDIVFELMPTITGTVICVAKVISLTRNSEKFKVLLQQTHEDWDNLLTVQEMRILTSYAENGRKFTLAYSISIIGFVFCYALLPLAGPVLDVISPANETRPRKMPHPAEYFLNQEEHYYPLLLSTYAGYVACVSIAVAADIMYVSLVEHICGMYGILCHRLENLTTCDELQWIDNGFKEIGRRARCCIQLHERIRLFTETMESTFSLFLLFDVGLGFVLHTSSCVMIVVRTGRSSEIVRYVALVLLQSCRSFFNSWAGQEMTDHSAGISIAAYNGMWYDAPVDVQKMLILLIARSQKANRLRIAKLYVINLEGFSTITYLIKCAETVDDMYNVLPPLIGSYIGLIKAISFRSGIEKFRMLIQYVCYDWRLVTRKREDMRIFMEYVERSRIFTKAYSIFIMTGVISYVTAPFTVRILDVVIANENVTRTKRFPHSAEFFVDMEKHYYILMSITYAGYFAACTIFIAIDSVYFMLLQHVCGMLAILCQRLETLADAHDKSGYKDHGRTSKRDKNVENMTQCVQLQLRIERFMRIRIVTCEDSMEMIRYGPLLFMQISRIFFNCWIGQQIIDHSCQLPVATYKGMWYETSLEIKKRLPLLLAKCQKSYRITMAKLFVISLESYSKTIYDNRYYYLNKNFLIVIGQWPYQSRLTANVMLAAAVFFIFSSTALEFWGLIAGIKDMSIVMENSSPLLVNTFIIVKLSNCFFNKHKLQIKKLIDDIEETWKMKQDGPENETLRSYAEKSKVFSKQYAFGLYVTWVFYSTMPVIVSGVYRLLPTNDTYEAKFLYRLEHVVNMDKYFNLLMFHGFLATFYLVSVPIALDTLFMVCAQHICSLFENIRYNLEQIPARTNVTLRPNITDDKDYDIIIYCIKWYKHTLDFSELLSSTFAMSFLIVLGTTVICLSFTAAELIMADFQVDEIIRILTNNLAQLLHLLVLNLSSQLIIDSSSEFQTTIYSCNWYTTSLRCRHLLKLTLLRASRPCQIKAGKMYVMSMETFSSILQVSMSYFTMLTSMMSAEHYKINRLFMSWIGQWPEQSGFNKYFLSFNLIFAVGGQFCLQMCGLVASWQDWDLVIECSSPIIIDLLCLVKFFNCLFNARNFKRLLVQMRDSWRLATYDAQIEILNHYTNKGKKLTKMYAAIMYGSMSMYITIPILPSIVAIFTSANQTQMYGLLYHVEAVFDVEKYYYIILLHSYYTTFFLMTIPVAADSMLIVYVQHACGLFHAVGYQLENVKQDDNLDINVCSLHEYDECYREISDSAIKHKEVLQFAELLASSYSMSLLVLTILNVTVVTFSGVQAVINFDQPAEAFRFAITAVCLMMHFLFLSLPGQKLIDHSSSVHQSICAANWYAVSLRARKLLFLMLMRCEVPCQITAGKMNVMSLRNFSAVVQASMSYFTVLTSMR